MVLTNNLTDHINGDREIWQTEAEAGERQVDTDNANNPVVNHTLFSNAYYIKNKHARQ